MKRIFLLNLILGISLLAAAKPARRAPITLTQPDGTTLIAYLHGDASFHFFTDSEGNRLIKEQDGFFHPAAALSEAEARQLAAQSPRRIMQQTKDVGDLNIAPRGLIILVNFTDIEFTTDYPEIDSMLNGVNYTRHYRGYNSAGKRTTITSSGSAAQYFRETSFGQYHPIFDVVGPVTVSKAHSYYGSNTGYYDQDAHPDMMIKEACELVDEDVDFTLYDNDGDGRVDFVYVIYAGYGEADGAGDDYIWPHNYCLSYTGVTCIVDGLRVDNYACSNEIDYNSKQHDGIGTFCHEFSHVLGLPDLYVTNNGTHKTLGAWDILDYGPYNNDGNTPPNYSAYERFFMGWIKPTVINTACDVTLPDLASQNVAVLLTATGNHNLVGTSPSPTDFYLLENRQKDGWDSHLPGHGLLVTHIKYSRSKWTNNTVNNTASSMGVDLVEADGDAPSYSEYNPYNGYSGKAKDAYPTGGEEFTDLPEYLVTNIDEDNGQITFKVNGGGEQIVLEVPNTKCETIGTKVISNGELLITIDGKTYNALGQRVL